MIEIESLVGGQKARAAQMPFADAGRGVARVVEALGDCFFRERQLLLYGRMEQLLRRTIRPSWQISCEMQAGRGFAGQDCCARWRTDRLRDVGPCETGTLR